jgi:serine/threonine protein phosphatase PrpC
MTGCTAVVVLVTEKHIICANSGDSRSVLYSNNTTYPLSFDHKPQNTEEKNRILEAGGFVEDNRVDGALALSRAMGDFNYKSNAGKPSHQ